MTMTWQPIETADKETTNIVLVSDGNYVGVGWFSEWDGWIDATDGKFEDPFNPQPTHWMPLPEPPASLPKLSLTGQAINSLRAGDEVSVDGKPVRIIGAVCYDPRRADPWKREPQT